MLVENPQTKLQHHFSMPSSIFVSSKLIIKLTEISTSSLRQSLKNSAWRYDWSSDFSTRICLKDMCWKPDSLNRRVHCVSQTLMSPALVSTEDNQDEHAISVTKITGSCCFRFNRWALCFRCNKLSHAFLSVERILEKSLWNSLRFFLSCVLCSYSCVCIKHSNLSISCIHWASAVLSFL